MVVPSWTSASLYRAPCLCITALFGLICSLAVYSFNLHPNLRCLLRYFPPLLPPPFPPPHTRQWHLNLARGDLRKNPRLWDTCPALSVDKDVEVEDGWEGGMVCILLIFPCFSFYPVPYSPSSAPFLIPSASISFLGPRRNTRRSGRRTHQDACRSGLRK
ncbi:hypothetical protein C8R44DRAFT_69010 [Mycena epipterygia]|nr:hypothetical protein C8R44DRAFT_69010 [Mycena epipterygia]